MQRSCRLYRVRRDPAEGSITQLYMATAAQRAAQWIAISFSRGSSQPRDQACISCIAGGFFTVEPPRNS